MLEYGISPVLFILIFMFFVKKQPFFCNRLVDKT